MGMEGLMETQNYVKAIADFLNLGKVGIFGGIFLIALLFGVYLFLKKAYKKYISSKNTKQRIEDSISNRKENEKISEGLSDAHEELEDVLSEDPPTGTVERPPEPNSDDSNG